MAAHNDELSEVQSGSRIYINNSDREYKNYL